MPAATTSSTVVTAATPSPTIGTVSPTWLGRALIAGSNILTITRVAVSPLPCFFVISQWWGFALAVYSLGLLTDFLDGTFARTFQSGSPFGRAMDSAADKMLALSALLGLNGIGYLPVWLPLAFVLREFAMFGLRSIRAADGKVIGDINDRLGRFRFTALHIGVLLMLAYPDKAPTWIPNTGVVVVVVAQVVAIAALVHYVRRDYRAIVASMEGQSRSATS